tara:strand:+ start:2482 stop:2895 length:414 start_codon:yes stop_codon:yes gene_type:complete
MKKNNLLAILDYCIIQIVPQMAQIDILKEHVSKFNKTIDFYSIESQLTLENCSVLKDKIKEKPKIDGFVFYSLLQLSYGNNINLELIEEILENNYKIYFYREKLRILNKNDFKKKYEKLSLFHHNNLSLIYKIKNLI